MPPIWGISRSKAGRLGAVPTGAGGSAGTRGCCSGEKVAGTPQSDERKRQRVVRTGVGARAGNRVGVVSGLSRYVNDSRKKVGGLFQS